LAYGRDGRLRVGPNVDFAAAAVASARSCIAEVNTAVVAPAGCPGVGEARLSAVGGAGRALPTLAGGAPAAVAGARRPAGARRRSATPIVSRPDWAPSPPRSSPRWATRTISACIRA